MTKRRLLWEFLLIPCVLAGIFWLFLGKFLSGEYSVATWVDNTHFLLPLFSHVSRAFAAGEFPYRINSIAGGVPLYNTPQFSLLYPFYFFRWDLYRTPVDALLHVHYVTLLHVAILWLNTYVMMRIFHLRVVSSVLGATFFAFSANTYEYLFWLNIIAPYSWLPLALGSVFLILENEFPKIGLVLGWVSIYLLVSASPAQPLIHFVYCAAVLAVSYAVVHRKHPSKWIPPLRNLTALAVGSVLLSSAILIPTIAFSRHEMVRWTQSGPIVGNQTIPFGGFLEGQLKPIELAKVLFPLNIPASTGDCYLGIIPLFLAVFAVFKFRRNWVIVSIFILAAYALLSSTGSHLGLAYVNYLLPLLNKIREPGRHLYVFGLSLCTLAAFGFEHLTESVAQRNWKHHAAVACCFLIVLGSSYWIRQRYETLISDSILLGSFALFMGALAATLLLRKFRGLAELVLVGIAVYPALYYPVPIANMNDGDYFSRENLHSHRILQQVAKIKDIGQYRVIISDDQFSPQYWSMNAAYYNVRTFQAFVNPLPAGQVQEMLSAPLLPRYAQLLGGKYYLACGNAVSPQGGYLFERDIEDCKLYSAPDARPYYFLSTAIDLSYRQVQQFLDKFQLADTNVNNLSVSSKDEPAVADWLGAATPSLQWQSLGEERSQNHFHIHLQTNRRSVLVLNEYFGGEWQVSLNGKKQRPLKVNLNQIGLLLPEGSNVVRFDYQPQLFTSLVFVQWITLALLAAGMIVACLKHFHENTWTA
ncbi:MAG TPA: hypothetical protein VKY31_09145 [Terriglobia bacterium]|nr:hypothetical protein [Terriglobia bacterium]